MTRFSGDSLVMTANDKPVPDIIGDHIITDTGQALEEGPIDITGSYSLHEGIMQSKNSSPLEGGAFRRKAKRYVKFCLIPQFELHLTDPLPVDQVCGTRLSSNLTQTHPCYDRPREETEGAARKRQKRWEMHILWLYDDDNLDLHRSQPLRQ